jgi:ribosomal protein S18 acetylase RimI-like enzyme
VPESVLTYLDDPAAEVLVAVADAHAPVLGVISLRVMLDLFHGAPTALIQELVVAEGHRGEGIGGALLDAAIARARERGCVEIAVVTGERNEAGQAAYRSRGFEPEGVYFERHLDE